MANYKRHRGKKQRSGCLLCKPHKAQGNSKNATKKKYQMDKGILYSTLPDDFAGVT